MVYFCADDYGIATVCNKRIEQCVKNGGLNQISLLPNGDLTEAAALPANNSTVNLSLHINLVEGHPLSNPEEIPLLVDENGNFKYSFIGLLALSFSRKRKELERQLYIELQKQITFWREFVGEDAEICIDSHQHAYMVPWIFKTLMRVLKDENVKVSRMRFPAEPAAPYLLTPSLYFSYSPSGLAKHWLLRFLALVNRKAIREANIKTTCFMGAMFSGHLTQDVIEKLMPKYKKIARRRRQDIEIAVHPGYAKDGESLLDGSREDFQRFYFSMQRKQEYDTVISLQKKQWDGDRPMYLDINKVDEKTREKLEDFMAINHRGHWIKKRLFDIFFATLILLGLLPLMIVIAIVICIDDPSAGPFFKQKRVGRHGEEFYMYKFRTMRPNAEAMLEELKDKNEMEGPVFKITDDPRVTRVGKILRKTSLDELMQFFNVFKGDMTLVGPRPPLPRETEQYTDYQKLRLTVTPGLTCTWQIHKNRNDVPFEEWVEMDLDYIENRTFPGDLLIMLKTPIVMLSGTGR